MNFLIKVLINCLICKAIVTSLFCLCRYVERLIISQVNGFAVMGTVNIMLSDDFWSVTATIYPTTYVKWLSRAVTPSPISCHFLVDKLRCLSPWYSRHHGGFTPCVWVNMRLSPQLVSITFGVNYLLWPQCYWGRAWLKSELYLYCHLCLFLVTDKG
jgi:hypothetical protein